MYNGYVMQVQLSLVRRNVPELGMGCHSYNSIFGTTVNPMDTTKAAGGSSGGAGAALASYMFSALDGSDMMGSLRNPAGWGTQCRSGEKAF